MTVKDGVNEQEGLQKMDKDSQEFKDTMKQMIAMEADMEIIEKMDKNSKEYKDAMMRVMDDAKRKKKKKKNKQKKPAVQPANKSSFCVIS